MSIINVNLNVAKFAHLIKETEQGDFVDLQITTFDKLDTYGRNVSVTIPQTKEEREAGEKKIYVGNGTVVSGGMTVSTKDLKENRNDQSPAVTREQLKKVSLSKYAKKN